MLQHGYTTALPLQLRLIIKALEWQQQQQVLLPRHHPSRE